MTYVPQPGTIPFRAIEFLKTLPVGSELSTVVLCDAIGQTTNNFPESMRPAMNCGAVKRRRRVGVARNLFWWSLGDGTPLPATDQHESFEDDQALDAAAGRPRAPAPVIPNLGALTDLVLERCEMNGVSLKRTCKHGVSMTAYCMECADAISADLKRESELPPVAAPLPRVRAGTAPARWGLYSDGDFHIQKAGAEIVLERAEFEGLVAFLERMAVTS